jgi:isocitrate dehydrogenase
MLAGTRAKESEMQTVRGVFNGTSIELYEKPPVEGESQVLVIFLEGSMATAAAREQRVSTFADSLRPPHFYGAELRRHLAQQYRRFTVGALMSRDLITVTPLTSVADALQLMRQNGVTSVLCEPGEGEGWGIMTIRDVLRHVVADDRSPDGVGVGEIASRPLIMVSPDMGLRECGELMLQSRVRRVVVHENQKPIGLVSDTDIFQFVEERGWGPHEEEQAH